MLPPVTRSSQQRRLLISPVFRIGGNRYVPGGLREPQVQAEGLPDARLSLNYTDRNVFTLLRGERQDVESSRQILKGLWSPYALLGTESRKSLSPFKRR